MAITQLTVADTIEDMMDKTNELVVKDNNLGTISVKDFGAIGDGVTDDRVAFQDAIDSASSLYAVDGAIRTVFIPDGVYLFATYVGIIPTGSGSQDGILCIEMKSGVRLAGNGTMTVPDSFYGVGAYFRIIGADKGAQVSDVSFDGFTINGNEANQVASVQCSNIVLEAGNNILVNSIKSINANGMCVMIRGSFATPMKNVRVVNNYADNATMIGIQCSQFDGLVISDNNVRNTADNGIDIYGDAGAGTGGTVGNGLNFVISGNTVKNSKTGIFPETVSFGTVTGNSVSSCEYGVWVNRIVSEPRGIIVSDNIITETTNVGVVVTGDTGGVHITNNLITDYTGSAVNIGNAGNVANVFVRNNIFSPSAITDFAVKITGALASRIVVTNNIIRNTANIPIANYYDDTSTASTGLVVGNWQLTHNGVSTGTEIYEQGTFIPVIVGETTDGVATYAEQLGSYTRIGNIVFVSISLDYSGATGTGTIYVKGFNLINATGIAQEITEARSDSITLTGTQIVKAVNLNIEVDRVGFRLQVNDDKGVGAVISWPTVTAYPAGKIQIDAKLILEN